MLPLFSWCSILLVVHHVVAIEEELLSKDLYKTLGVGPKASTAEIKKAYRKLARETHPDKAPPEEREERAEKFRRIAQAYEVLCKPETREEYEHFRQYGDYGEDDEDDEDDEEDRRRQKEHQDMQNMYDMFENLFKYNAGPPPENFERGFRLSYNHRVIPAGQIIFPYDPVYVSMNKYFFGFLSLDCSYSVYAGDTAAAMQYLEMIGPRMGKLKIDGVKRIYTTGSMEELDGRCFAAVDQYGGFSVYEGDPQWDSELQWTSRDEMDQPDARTDPLRTFFLQLTNEGEVRVISRHRARGSYRGTMGRNIKEELEDKCVWGSQQCGSESKGVLGVIQRGVIAGLTKVFTTVITGVALTFVMLEEVLFGDGLEMIFNGAERAMVKLIALIQAILLL